MNLSEEVLVEHKKAIEKLCKDVANVSRDSLRSHVSIKLPNDFTYKYMLFIGNTFCHKWTISAIHFVWDLHQEPLGWIITGNSLPTSWTFRTTSKIVSLSWWVASIVFGYCSLKVLQRAFAIADIEVLPATKNTDASFWQRFATYLTQSLTDGQHAEGGYAGCVTEPYHHIIFTNAIRIRHIKHLINNDNQRYNDLMCTNRLQYDLVSTASSSSYPSSTPRLIRY